MEASPAYFELNRQWKTTCRILFGRDVGELEDFSHWLSERNYAPFTPKSCVSGSEVVLTHANYNSDSKFISFDEVDFSKKFEPLSINDVKDMDSVIRAVRERVFYCGNIVLGNSKYVESSSNVSDSFFVYDSRKVSDSKNIAFSQYLRLGENLFGVNEGGEAKFCVRCSILFRNQRCFELWCGCNSADCYYSFGLDDCRENLFSFNLIGKTCTVGNLELPKEKYLEIKRKLLSEIALDLATKKRVPSLVEIASRAENSHPGRCLSLHRTDENSDLGPIQDAFSKTFNLLFGSSASAIDAYSSWLEKNTVTPHSVPSVLSTKPVSMSNWPGLSALPLNRVVSHLEALELGKSARIPRNDAEKLTLSNAHELIGGIAYFSPEHFDGKNENLIGCQWGSSALNCYKSVICVYSKNCAYSSWPRSSQYCFGSGIVFDSEFCMNCYDSVKLKRCLEIDAGRDCADTFFSHNVENVGSSLFCFNIKNQAYSFGNTEIGKEKFLQAKRAFQAWALEKLEKKKCLGLSVYNLGVSGVD